uniref:pentapeptide repeat-containing protein n=1 Tax=Flavobacterium caeni TaxID=490189 RepID=UPI001B8D58FB
MFRFRSFFDLRGFRSFWRGRFRRGRFRRARFRRARFRRGRFRRGRFRRARFRRARFRGILRCSSSGWACRIFGDCRRVRVNERFYFRSFGQRSIVLQCILLVYEHEAFGCHVHLFELRVIL